MVRLGHGDGAIVRALTWRHRDDARTDMAGAIALGFLEAARVGRCGGGGHRALWR